MKSLMIACLTGSAFASNPNDVPTASEGTAGPDWADNEVPCENGVIQTTANGSRFFGPCNANGQVRVAGVCPTCDIATIPDPFGPGHKRMVIRYSSMSEKHDKFDCRYTDGSRTACDCECDNASDGKMIHTRDNDGNERTPTSATAGEGGRISSCPAPQIIHKATGAMTGNDIQYDGVPQQWDADVEDGYCVMDNAECKNVAHQNGYGTDNSGLTGTSWFAKNEAECKSACDSSEDCYGYTNRGNLHCWLVWPPGATEPPASIASIWPDAPVISACKGSTDDTCAHLTEENSWPINTATYNSGFKCHIKLA